MIQVVINPKSSANTALQKWRSISSLIPHDKVIELEDFLRSTTPPKTGDFIIAAGGDGCLHSIVNFVVKKFGFPALDVVSFGYIGLGSNNSFLQPLDKKYVHNGIPVQISPTLHQRDLVEVQIKTNGSSSKHYIVSNASLGFLSYANLTFNQNYFVQLLKKLSVSLADVASFFITLLNFKNLNISIAFHEGGTISFPVTNLHWLKSPYFTKDLHFETSPLDSGVFDFYVLPGKSRLEIMNRFLSMLILKKMSAGFDTHKSLERVTISSKENVPLEIDGEIYFGHEFVFQIHPKIMRTMS